MDPARFDCRDIIEMAIRMEENGFFFYSQFAEITEAKGIKDILILIAGEEKKHISIFKRMIQDYETGYINDAYDPYMEETSLYLNALANSCVFTENMDIQGLSSTIKSEDNLLDKAISLEKESVLFYHKLELGTRDDDRFILAEIISEEKRHIALLSKLREQNQADEREGKIKND